RRPCRLVPLVERPLLLPARLRGLSVPRERVELFWRAAPVGAGLLALALGLTRLGAQPFSYDERFSVRTSSGSVAEIWHAARRTEAPHLLYYLLLKPWVAVFGTSHWAVRLPSVLAGALATWVTAHLGTRLFGRLAGLAAGLA